MPDSIVEMFEEKYDVKVQIDNFSSNEELFAKLLSGATGYDIIVPSQDYVSIMIKLGMLEKLDHSKLPNLKYISDVVKEKAQYDSNLDYAVPYFSGALGIAVNKEKVHSYDKDWSIFERTDLKNKMTMMDDMREVIGDALKYLGYSVNSTNKKELQEAEDLIINKWKPNLVKFDSESCGKAFASGDFYVVHGYSEVVFGEVPEEKWDTIDFFIPHKGATMYIDSMAIPKGVNNYDLALKFINFIQDPEIYAIFLDEFGFPPTVNPEAEKYMETTPFYTADDLVNCEIMDDLGEDLALFNDSWQRIRFTK